MNEPGPSVWFFERYFISMKPRTCAVCGRKIRPGDAAIANFERKESAHFGCGTIEPRRPHK